MELKQKKRLIGFVVMAGIVLLQLPFLFHSKKTHSHATISLEIPKPPEAPKVTALAASITPEVSQSKKVSVKNIEHSPEAKVAFVADKANSPVVKNNPAKVVEKKHVAVKKVIKVKNTEKPHVTKVAHQLNKQHKPAAASAWSIQVGVFSSQQNAAQLVAKLRKSGYESYMRATKCAGKSCLIVYVGPEMHLNKIKTMQTNLTKRFALKGIVKKYQL